MFSMNLIKVRKVEVQFWTEGVIECSPLLDQTIRRAILFPFSKLFELLQVGDVKIKEVQVTSTRDMPSPRKPQAVLTCAT